MVMCPVCKGTSSSPYVCTECGAAMAPSMPHPHAPASRPPPAPQPVRITGEKLRPVPPVAAHAPGSHGLSPAQIAELRNLDRAALRRRMLRQFVMATVALIVIATLAWVLLIGKANKREKLRYKDLPPEVAAIVGKRFHGRDDISTLCSSFHRLGTEADAGILKAGIARKAIAAEYKVKWTALEGARLAVELGVSKEDLKLMGELGNASQHLGNYLNSFSGWKPDESGTELKEALGGFTRVSADALDKG